jgi:hypothetical protein
MTFEFNQKPGVVVTLFFRYAGITGFVESDPGLDQRGLGYGVGRDAFGVRQRKTASAETSTSAIQMSRKVTKCWRVNVS